ncbi:MAG: hypothetical protein AB7O24_11780 [Kofleriaceae bacterium]
MFRRLQSIVGFVTLVVVASCQGFGSCGGCATVEPIPGGFPVNKRVANATQVRLSSTALDKLEADPAGIVGPLFGTGANGAVEFPVPANCGSSPSICCPGGTPNPACGPLEIDLAKRNGDEPRLELVPLQGEQQLDLTIRSRVKTKMDLQIGFLGANCLVTLDSTLGPKPDLKIEAEIHFSQDTTTKTTRVLAQWVTVSQIDWEDITLTPATGGLGDVGCSAADTILPLLLPILSDQIGQQIEDTINVETCKKCPSGDVDECGSSFATACTDGVCRVGDRCLQELGIAGRARGSTLFGAFSPGTTGAIDLYQVAGGYATTQNNGLALGILGGIQPGGTPRDRCGPSAASMAPPAVTIGSPSPYFQGNTRPDTGDPFDIAVGLHKSQLAQFAWAGYEGGLLCLTFGTSAFAQLSTDTVKILTPSLGALVQGNSKMAVGLRPQSPPSITLGKNTFVDDGNGGKRLTDPLIDLRFTGLEIDFFASVDDQYVRVFTIVSDVHFPVGLQVTGMGQISPVFADPDDAFTNVSVKNSEALTETPEQLAALLPNILNVVLPQASNAIGAVTLPSLGGLALHVTDITAVDDNNYLAIFANLEQAPALQPVATTAQLTRVNDAEPAIVKDPLRWRSVAPPSAVLELSGDASDLEFSYRIDDGTWSPWSTNGRPAVSSKAFWLSGVHKIEVQARRIGRPETLDLTPASLEVGFGDAGERRGPGRGFHGNAGNAGCSCDSSGSPANAAPLALVLLLLVMPWRRVRRWRGLRVLAGVASIAMLASLPGCSCSDAPCGDVECLPGEATRGGLGRWTSIASDSDRVLVATYDTLMGDVVAIDATDPANLVYTAVDGIPADVTPIYDPSGYRGGVDDIGPDIGAWTSVALSDGVAKIAYQDREAGALKYAYETAPGKWTSYVVDPGNGELVGNYAAMIIDASGKPAIAYLAVGIDDGAGHRVTELRLARASSASPSGNDDWTIHTITSAPGTCAGLCGAGEACVAGAPELCSAVSTCTPDCAAGSVCVAGACQTEVADPVVNDIASGTGLFVSLVTMADGRIAASYYDRTSGALKLALEASANANTFTETVLDQQPYGDRGWWSSAVVDASGTIHVAYQDALGDQLMHTTWNGGPGTPEVVDDGQRMDDRPHPVGAAAAIYLLNGSPAIAYQDGATADVYLATRGTSAWTITALASGPLLEGQSISATTSHGAPVLAWGALEPTATPVGKIVVRTP